MVYKVYDTLYTIRSGVSDTAGRTTERYRLFSVFQLQVKSILYITCKDIALNCEKRMLLETSYYLKYATYSCKPYQKIGSLQ